MLFPSRLLFALGLLFAALPFLATPTAKFEIRFLKGMIDHHAMAIEMGEICLRKAGHEDLRSLCEGIINAQSQEMETMQSWLAEWYGITYAAKMKPGDHRNLERLASLSGAEFEIKFMQMMIRHHEAAIHKAEKCLDRADHKPLVRLCEDIIGTQRAEIEQLEA